MLTIDRLQLACSVARDHPAAEAVAARLRSIGQRRVGASLGTVLERTCAPGDERVILVRRLEVRLDVDVASGDDAISEALAAAIAAALHAVADDGESRIEFVDHVDQLARLLADLAAGVAWHRWYHRDAFPGMVHLLPSVAIRTIAEHEPAHFAAGAERLTMRSLAALTAAIHPADAARILAVLPASDLVGGEPVEAVVAQVLDARTAPPSDVLFVVLAARRRVTATAAEIVSVVEDLVGLDASARSDDVTSVSTQRTTFGAVLLLLPYLAEAACHGLLPSPADRYAVVAALAGPAALADPAVLAVLADDGADPPEPAIDNATATLEWLQSALAVGPIELGTHVVRSRGHRVAVLVDEPTGHWLAIQPGAATAVWRPLLAKYPATQRAPRRAVGDTLRFLHLAAPEHTVIAANVLRRFAASLPGFALADAAHLWREALECGATVGETSSGWHVELERPPLAEILRVCGHGDRAVSLPWRHGRLVHIEVAG